jgi:hypothetical protein
MTAVLKMLQTEYDAVVLELFDTRRVLEETRKELSVTLYIKSVGQELKAKRKIRLHCRIRCKLALFSDHTSGFTTMPPHTVKPIW